MRMIESFDDDVKKCIDKESDESSSFISHNGVPLQALVKG